MAGLEDVHQGAAQTSPKVETGLSGVSPGTLLGFLSGQPLRSPVQETDDGRQVPEPGEVKRVDSVCQAVSAGPG